MQNVMQNIILALQNKQYDTVIQSCQNLLNSGNQHPQIQLFMAIALGESGKIDQASKIFEQLINQLPNNPDIHYNYALNLHHNGSAAKAIKHYAQCTKLNPQHASAWNNLGDLYLKTAQSEHAIHAYSQACRYQPNQIDYVRNLANAYYNSQQLSHCIPLYHNILNQKQAQDNDYLNLIESHLSLRQLAAATEILKMALIHFPHNAMILNMGGMLETEKRKFIQAIRYLEKAHKLEPQSHAILQNLISVYSYSGAHDQATEFINKLQQSPNENDWVFLCMHYISNNQSELAQQTIEKGLAAHKDQAELLLLKAKTLKSNGSHIESINHINKAIEHTDEPALLAEAHHEIGFNLDKLKQFNEAWPHFQKGNQLNLSRWKKMNPQSDNFIQQSQQISTGFKNTKTIKKSTSSAGENLIFIVGFPRSGTTLLDHILASQPNVQILEEAPVLGEVFGSLQITHSIQYAEKLNQLTEQQCSDLAKQYYRNLESYTDYQTGNILVDKSPLNTIHAGLILKIFPKSKLVFAHRHPLDVCLSCFMQDFKINSFMTNLTDIEHTALTYNAMLQVWKNTIESFESHHYYQSYEALVNDFKNQSKDLFNYLGMQWNETVLQFHNSKNKRGTITTPSYDQVNQPIYQSSSYRFRNYQSFLTQAHATLEPWIKYFNYKQ